MKQSKVTTYRELKKWFESYITDGKAPFSFTLEHVKGLGGCTEAKTESFKDVSARWKQSVKASDGKYDVTYLDEVSHLKFELTAELYKDVPAFDYVVKVTNVSETESSPVIAGFSSMDMNYHIKKNSQQSVINVENANGSTARADDFEQKNYVLEETLNFKNENGRSTDDRWPYFAVDGTKDGFLLAVAWSGNWDVTFTNVHNIHVGIKVDLLNFKSYLLPGESIRSQRIVFVANEADNAYGHNLFRRMVVNHYTPYCREGKPFTPPIAINFWGGRNTAFISKVAKAYADAGIKADTVWLDAAWYGNYPFMGEDKSVGWGATSGGSWEQQIGVWTPNRNLYPHGMKPLADFIHENTPYKMMLWWMMEDGRYNPYNHTYEYGNGEKVTVTNDVLAHQTFGAESYYTEFYEKDPGRRVLKLSDEKVFKKVLNYYRYMFSCENIDWMRIDYWARPARSWLVNDKEEATELAGEEFSEYRSGMTENKYIVNLYRFFDTMYEEFPGWLLDNCCSGGRRLDLEMALRGIPLWRTDYNNASKPDYCEANQVQTQYLSRWLPFTGIGVTRPTEDKYYERSFYCAGPCIGGNKLSEEGLTKLKKLVDEYVSIRHFWQGDYYQIVPVANDKTSWQCYELCRDDLDEALVVCIARSETTQTVTKHRLCRYFKLKGLDPKGTYLIHDIDDVECKNDRTDMGYRLMRIGILGKANRRPGISVYTVKRVKQEETSEEV